MRLTDFLRDVGQPAAYYPKLTKITGGVKETLFLCYLIYWTGKQKDSDGWIYKTREEIEEETGLSRWEQEAARKNLKARGFIEEKYAGLPRKLYFRVDMEAVNTAWESYLSGSVAAEETAPASLHESHLQVCTKTSCKEEVFPPACRRQNRLQAGGKTSDLSAETPPAITKITAESDLIVAAADKNNLSPDLNYPPVSNNREELRKNGQKIPVPGQKDCAAEKAARNGSSPTAYQKHPPEGNSSLKESTHSVPEDEGPYSPAFGELYRLFEQEFGRPLSPFEAEQISKWLKEMPPELVREALRRAVLMGRRNLKYVDGILKSWRGMGFRTLFEVLEHEEERGKAREADTSRKSGGWLYGLEDAWERIKARGGW
ncbi:DnaD domain-containing protein [Ammonifex thiophilus]|uniref:DnaD domain-containing protein n=1 Tax=Ammonifex thiophilus TaxID=444093 RepID=UPI001402AD1B|nr:DnaD domain protein [Ammonifex thiophilus]